MKQEEIWLNLSAHKEIEDVVNAYNNPSYFQLALKDIIDSYADKYKKVIEVGCDTGITSLILDDQFKKTYLDLNPKAINILEQSAKKLKKDGDFVIADMFKMPFSNESFDIVFNAGVIEHFDLYERTLALKEYARILRKDGLMLIAFPNHYSVPYRISYLYKNLRKTWLWPQEYKIYDLRREIEQAGLCFEKRIVVNKENILNWIDFCYPLKKTLFWLDKCLNFEGYLTVIFIRKV